MGKRINYYLSKDFELILCIFLAPLLHGLHDNGLELKYDIDDLRIAAFVEYVVLVLDTCNEVISVYVHNVFSVLIIAEVFTDIGIRWTINTTLAHIAIQLGIRILLLDIIRLVTDSVKYSPLLLSSKLTLLKRTFYVFSRLFHIGLIITLCVCLLIMRISIIPKLFIPNSPALVRPPIQTKATLWKAADMGEKIFINEYRPEYKTNHIARTPGEDIKMYCRLPREFYSSGTKVFWKFNRKVIKNDRRHRISSYIRKDNIVFILTLTDIQRPEFGQYMCCLRDSDVEEGNRIRPKEIRTIYLVERDDTVLSIRAAIGAAMNIENIFIYNVIRNKTTADHIKMDWVYEINGFNFSKACPVVQDSMQLRTADYKSIKYPSPSCAHHASEYRCNFSLIVCKDTYGLHTFAALKTDVTQNNTTINHLRVKIILLPQMTPISKQKYYEVYRQIEKDFRRDPSIKHNSSLLELLRSKEESETEKLEQWAKMFCVLGPIISCFMSWLDIYFYIMESHIIFGFRQKKEHRLGFSPRQNNSNDKYMYDIFISFCDSDRKFAYKKLLSVLRDKLGLKVCVPDVDMRHGNTLMSEYYDHISSSKNIIVVASENYLQDAICNNMQFSMLIVPMLYTKEKSYEDILILMRHPCNIPEIYNQFLTISHWDEYKNLDVLAREIKLWMNKPNVVANNVFFDTLFRVAAMLEGM